MPNPLINPLIAQNFEHAYCDGDRVLPILLSTAKGFQYYCADCDEVLSFLGSGNVLDIDRAPGYQPEDCG